MAKIKVEFEFDEGQLSDAMERWGPFPFSVVALRKEQILGQFLADFLVQGGLFDAGAELLGVGIEARRSVVEPAANDGQVWVFLGGNTAYEKHWLRRKGYRDIPYPNDANLIPKAIQKMEKLLTEGPEIHSLRGNFADWSDGVHSMKLEPLISVSLVGTSGDNGHEDLEWPRCKN